MSHRRCCVALALGACTLWGSAAQAEKKTETSAEAAYEASPTSEEKAAAPEKANAAATDSLFVSCWRLPVHSGPSPFTQTKGALSFGDAVTTLDGADARKEKSGWVHIHAGGLEGYVPANVLVSERVLNREDPSRALRKAQNNDSKQAGHGFSEDENKNDLVAMKGAGGEANAGAANYAEIDRILSAPAEYDPAQAYASFRKAGKTAEFSPAPSDEKKEERP